MKTWTVKQMLAERPCPEYTEEVLSKLWAGRKAVSWLDIAVMDIPAADKMWGAFRKGVLTKSQTKIVLEKIVTRVVTNHALHCGIKAVEEWAKKWLSGEDCTAKSARATWTAAAARATVEVAWAVEAAWATWAAEAAIRAAVETAWAAEVATRAAVETAWAAETAWAVEAAARAAKSVEAARAAEYKLQVADVLAVLKEAREELEMFQTSYCQTRQL